jgi:hypothetical protein
MFFFYTYVMFLFTASPKTAVEGKRLNEVFENKIQNTEIEMKMNQVDQGPQTPRKLAGELFKGAGNMCYAISTTSQAILAGTKAGGTAGNDACTALPATQGDWEYIQIAPSEGGLAKAGISYISTAADYQKLEMATTLNTPAAKNAPTLAVTPALAEVSNGNGYVANVGALYGGYYGYNAATGTAWNRADAGAVAAAGPFGFLGFQAGIAVKDLSYDKSTFEGLAMSPTDNTVPANVNKAIEACVLPLTASKACPAKATASAGKLKYSFYGYFGGSTYEALFIGATPYTQLIARNKLDVTTMAPTGAANQDKIKICYDTTDDSDATKCQKITEVPTAGKAFTTNLYIKGASDSRGVNVDFSKNINYGQIKKAGAAPNDMNAAELASLAAFDATNSALSESTPNGATFALSRDAGNNLFLDIQIPVIGKPLAKNGGYFVYDPTISDGSSGAAEKSVVVVLLMSVMVGLWSLF